MAWLASVLVGGLLARSYTVRIRAVRGSRLEVYHARVSSEEVRAWMIG